MRLNRRRGPAPTWLLLLGFAAPLGAAEPGADRVLLRVEGAVAKPLRLTAADLAALPHQDVRAVDRDGREATYSGVPLGLILEAAGVPRGEHLRGEALAHYAVVTAIDGYRVVFALPELDPAFTDRVVLLADARDGRPLEHPEGPIRLLVPGEKRHARWVRQVVMLSVRKPDAYVRP